MEKRSDFEVVVVAPGYRDYTEENKALSALGVTVKEVQSNGDVEQLKQVLQNVDLFFVRDVRIDAQIINALNRCKGIVRYGVGVDNVDLQVASAKKIAVANVPDYGAEIEVSDHAAALTLALVRRVVSRNDQTRKLMWNIAQAEPIYRIAEATLGLAGFGKIARAYLQRMRAFGIRDVLVYDPYITDEFAAEHGVVRADFDQICKKAQIISLHAPATPETRNMINERTLSLMNEKTCLVNTSRGALVDTGALAKALKAGKIFGAALDVLDQEPVVKDCSLLGLSNVIITDHTGWYSESSVRTIQQKAGQAAFEILTTGEPTNWVNKW